MKQKEFKKEAQCCVVSILKKIFDKSPFTCECVRYFAVVDTDPAFAAVEFEGFKEESDRLENLFFQKVNIQNYKSLSFVVKLVLTLSYGQA